VHLMVSDDILLSQIEEFAGAGADVISIHLENDRVADAALARIEELEVATGMALQIESDVSALEPYLDRLHFVTILGTRPGIKGVEPDGRAPERLRKVAAMINRQETDRRVVLAADGGIRRHTVPVLRRSGADSVVAGSLVFGAPDLAERISWLRSL
ncbi:MAG: D-allulose-6-phosphate 3-epimerase, partial [Bacteroidota bacterium]